MKFQNLNRALSVTMCAAVICLLPTAQASGQATPPADKLTADKTFELNIVSERITEANFKRSTAVELTGAASSNSSGDAANNIANNVRLEVGVGASAERIDVLLRGIFGRVTFRGSLETIRQRINRLKAVANQPPAPL